MKSMWLGGIILIIALMAGTYFVVGDAFDVGGEDMINNLTMLGALAIIAITILVALKYISQIKNEKASGELVEENWDGIGEYLNDIPTGWAIAYLGTTIWALWYFFIGYPYNQFSQIGQWNEETIEHQVKFEERYKNIDENGLQAMGQSVYLVQCAPCHGIDSEGINGKAQDLTKRISKDSVLAVIKDGSAALGSNPAGNLGYAMGAMPGGMASGTDAEEIAIYVAGGLKGEKPAGWASCSSCHGVDGKGMAGMSPNLLAYDNTLVTNVLEYGKKSSIGEMPSFKGRLSETQVKAVAAYLRSLGE